MGRSGQTQAPRCESRRRSWRDVGGSHVNGQSRPDCPPTSGAFAALGSVDASLSFGSFRREHIRGIGWDVSLWGKRVDVADAISAPFSRASTAAEDAGVPVVSACGYEQKIVYGGIIICIRGGCCYAPSTL